MGELQTEYAGRADFNIISAEETAKRGDEIEEFGFTELKHGLVVFAGDGVAVALLPGHNFGREEIEAALTPVLAGE